MGDAAGQYPLAGTEYQLAGRGVPQTATRQVELSGLNQNTWRKVQKLAAAWEKVRAGSATRGHDLSEPPPMPVAQPSRRARTPLTPSEVDSIRTLRAAGVSVNQLAKQFGVHRATIWEQTTKH